LIRRSLGDLELSDAGGRSAADPFPDLDPAHGVEVRVVEVTKQTRHPHLHPKSVEVIHVLEGEGRHWQDLGEGADGEWTNLAPGEVVLVPAGVAHVSVALPGGRLRLLCFFPDPDLPGNIEELPREISLPQQ